MENIYVFCDTNNEHVDYPNSVYVITDEKGMSQELF